MTIKGSERHLPIPRVIAALCVIAVLALVLPFALVQAFHQRRTDRADGQLQAIAESIRASAPGAAAPAGTLLLAGKGPRPTVVDEIWSTAPAFPLSRLGSDPGPDPWGNAYLVNTRDPARPWVISAGPDGILQTSFSVTPDTPAGDDRIAFAR